MRFKFGYQNNSLRNLRIKTNNWKQLIIYFLYGLPIIWQIFKNKTINNLKKNQHSGIRDQFNEFNPDIVIHPSVLEGLFINDLILTCELKKIPLVVIMNSWDNPSTKRAVIGKPSYLLVWGEQTFQHSLKYLKMSPNKIIKFGSAQFDIFSNKTKLDKKAFRKIYDIKKNEIVILYAGSSKSTDEIKHLSMLDNAINEKILREIKVIYRPHPWGGGGKNGKFLLDQNWNNIKIDKNMYEYLLKIKRGSTKKYLADYKETHEILSNVDAVISPLSTILIEAAMHGKPSLCFLPFKDNSKHLLFDSKLIHFKEFFENKNFLKAVGYNEFIINTIKLANKTKVKNISNILKKEAEFYVSVFDESYPKRILKFIENVSKKRVS